MVIFDFDGTIADTYTVVFNHIDRLSEFKVDGFDINKVDHYKEIGLRELIKELKLTKFKIFTISLKFRKLFGEYVTEIKPVDGIGPALEVLQQNGFKMGILSSNSKSNIDTILKLNSLSNYFTFVDSEFALFSKANKLEKLISKHKLDKNDVFYVGDEVRDVEAAKESGVKSIAVTWGYNKIEALKAANPDYIVNSTKELTDIFIKS